MTAVEWLLNELSIAGYFPYGIPPKIEEQAKEMEKEQSLKVPPYNLDDLANKANGYLYCDSKKEHKALAFDDGYKVGFKKALELLTFKSE